MKASGIIVYLVCAVTAASCSSAPDYQADGFGKIKDTDVSCIRGYTILRSGNTYRVTEGFGDSRSTERFEMRDGELLSIETSPGSTRSGGNDLDIRNIGCAIEVMNRSGSGYISSIGGRNEYTIVHIGDTAFVKLFGDSSSLNRLASVYDLSKIEETWFSYPSEIDR